MSARVVSDIQTRVEGEIQDMSVYSSFIDIVHIIKMRLFEFNLLYNK